MKRQSIAVCLYVWLLIQFSGGDILLDDFTNYFGGTNDQCHIGEALGYSIVGPNAVDTGGGWWRPFTDTLGTVITGGSGTVLDTGTYARLVESSAMHIIYKTYLCTANMVDTWPYAYISCNMAGDTATWFDFSNLTSIKLKLKGSGSIRFSFRTKDISDLFAGDSSAWGFYGFKYDLTPDWKEIIISTTLFSPEPFSPPADSQWTWDHGKNAVKAFDIYACPDEDTTTNDSTELYIDAVTFEGITWQETFNFEYVDLPNLTAVPGDKTHFILDTTVTLSSALSIENRIYYTTDGTAPDTGDTSQLYTTPFTISGDTVVVQAVITVNNVILESKSWTYYQDVIPVVLTAVPGDSSHFSLDTSVTLTAIPPDASIRYTLDGSVPTTGSPLYTGPITLNQSTTLRAMSYRFGYIGTYGSWDYICDLLASWLLANPGDSAQFGDTLTVNLTTNADTILYTTDGTDPATNGTVYTGPFKITGDTVVVQAIAVGDGYDTIAGIWHYFGIMTGIDNTSPGSVACKKLSLRQYCRTGNNILLHIGIPDNTAAYLSIFTPAGRKIVERTIRGCGYHTVTISDELIGKGIYLIRLTHGREEIIVKNIVQ